MKRNTCFSISADSAQFARHAFECSDNALFNSLPRITEGATRFFFFCGCGGCFIFFAGRSNLITRFLVGSVAAAVLSSASLALVAVERLRVTVSVLRGVLSVMVVYELQKVPCFYGLKKFSFLWAPKNSPIADFNYTHVYKPWKTQDSVRYEDTIPKNAFFSPCSENLS